MYTRASTIEMKEKVLQSFTKIVDCNLRIVIATSAFGMGIDCKDIRRIIHWGAPSTLEQYVQESGRGGRDGEMSESLMLYGNIHRYVDKDVRLYATNKDVCRRKLLYQDFLFASSDNSATNVIHACDCCDICAHKCTCSKCSL